MAHNKSTQKRIRQAEKRRARNRAAKSTVKSFKRKLTEAIDEKKGKEEILAAYKDYMSNLDKIACKGIIHKKTADRNKSRTWKHIKSAISIQ